MADFAAAKALLMQESPNQPGANLYDHLTSVLLQLLDQPGADPLSVIEELSAAAKRAATPGGPSEGEQAGMSHARLATARAKTEWAAGTQALFKANANFDGVQNLMDHMDMLEWAGVGIAKEDAYRLMLSLRLLYTNQGQQCLSLRFFGKVLGLQGDYFVAEGQLNASGEADTREVEAGGSNMKTYWVCAAIGAPWVKLPKCERKCVVAARKIRKHLTGNLNAPVSAHPPFPGCEKNLLRAQIARIAAYTSVSPSGYFRMGEEEEEGRVVADEEFDGAEDLDVDGWVRHAQLLTVRGGATVYVAPVVGDEEPEEDPDAPEETELLGGLEGEGEWSKRPPEEGKSVLRCERWPGAWAMAEGKDYTNVYFGYAVERPAGAGEDGSAAAAFSPVAPGPVGVEYDDSALAEQADVLANPFVAPPPPEPEEVPEGEEGEGEGEEES